ncbi:MAG: glycoside hydrolase domain-containing protein, partial [Abditibacteriaceae bacterium]
MSTTPTVVPAPWLPIKVSHNTNAIQLEVQGRSYTFGNQAALPTRIQTKGVDILAAPIRLVGKIDGEPIEWHEPYVALLSQDDSQATITGAMGTAGLSVGNTVNIGFDGAIRFDTTIAPWILKSLKSKAEQMQQLDKLEALWLEIPLHAKYSSLFTWWPIDPQKLASTTQLSNSGAIPAEGMALPFKPFIWLGWQDGGLSWFCESA